MKRVLLPFAVVLAIAPRAVGHVGSPNVFFEGRAGAYSVYAVVRPPAALPGAAQVSVRVREPSARSVSLLPVLWQTGRQGSPLPVAAVRVPGETNLWSGEVWFLRPGSYTMRIGVEGGRETGEASVPVNVLGAPSQQMKPGLRAMLGISGLVLLLGAVWIVGGIAREGPLLPGAKPGIVDHARGRRVAAVAALVLAAGAAAGGMRWRNMDLAYRTQGLQKPEPVAAEVRAETNRIIVELRQAEQSLSLPSWAALAPDHGKLMHLFLVREPELDAFAHLHPIRQDAHRFALEVPALPVGAYQLYGDVTFENGISQTLIARVSLPAPVGPAFALPPLTTNFAAEAFCGFATNPASNPGPVARDMDDSWHVGRGGPLTSALSHSEGEKRLAGGGVVARLMGGYSLLFENAGAVAAGYETLLRFAAFSPDGREATLQPYMGMLGHAAVRRQDGSVFAHLHPLGSFSMASQEVFRQRETRSGADNPGSAKSVPPANTPANRVSFPYQFPKPGQYRLWIQVRIAGRVLTAVYDIEIKLEK